MTVLIAQALQVLLVVLLAPLLIGYVRKVRAGLLRHRCPPFLQPYRDVVRLIHKDAVVADTASWLFRVATYLVFSAIWVAAAVVPTFASDLGFSRAADLILSGDDHDLTVQYDGRTVLVESFSQGKYVMAVDLTIEATERDGKVNIAWWPDFRIIDTATVEPDPELAAMVTGYEAELSSELDRVIGRTGSELDSRRATVRTGEAAIGNLIADAMREATKADIALMNGGGIRADRTYDAGTVLTRRDIQSELPFGNKTILIEVSGADLRAALENGVSAVEDGGGRFPHVSGLTFSYDASKPVGERVTDIRVGDAPLEDAATFKLATNDFMGDGGDGYAMFIDKPRIIDANAGGLMAQQVIDYIDTAGSVAPAVEGRITRLN